MPSSWTRGNGRVLERPRFLGRRQMVVETIREVPARPRSCCTVLALLATLEHPGIPWPDAVTSIEARDGRLVINYAED